MSVPLETYVAGSSKSPAAVHKGRHVLDPHPFASKA